MEAEIVKRHYGVSEGEVHPKYFEVGTIVRGQVAEAAVAMGDAVELGKKSEAQSSSYASLQAPASQESKPKRRRGRPPKSSASMTPGD